MINPKIAIRWQGDASMVVEFCCISSSCIGYTRCTLLQIKQCHLLANTFDWLNANRTMDASKSLIGLTKQESTSWTLDLRSKQLPAPITNHFVITSNQNQAITCNYQVISGDQIQQSSSARQLVAARLPLQLHRQRPVQLDCHDLARNWRCWTRTKRVKNSKAAEAWYKNHGSCVLTKHLKHLCTLHQIILASHLCFHRTNVICSLYEACHSTSVSVASQALLGTNPTNAGLSVPLICVDLCHVPRSRFWTVDESNGPSEWQNLICWIHRILTHWIGSFISFFFRF